VIWKQILKSEIIFRHPLLNVSKNIYIENKYFCTGCLKKLGPVCFSQLLQHLGIKWSALGKNWVLAHLENIQKLIYRLWDAWDIQQRSIRVSFKSEQYVLITVFVKNLKKKTFHILCEDYTKNKKYKQTNRKNQIKQE
jgi:hypothetical protein